MTTAQAVIAREFREFDAFIEAIEDTKVRCTLPCHQTSLWRVTGVCMPGGVHAQLAAMGSGNIAQYGQPMPAAKPARGRPVTIDRAAIARAVDCIESCPATVVPMAELVQTTSHSERSLRAGFQRYLGLSPKRYMQLRLLKVVRQRLIASDPGEATVTQVVGELGVWDVGRFAGRYRETFGELPSTTLGKSGRQGG